MNIWLKRLISLALFAALVYFFLPLIGEVQAAAGLLRRAAWGWFFAGVGVQLISYAFLTWLNQLSLRPFSGQISFGRLTALLTAMAFIQIALPSGGASGAALRVRLLGKYGYTPEAALFSLMVETLAEAFALASVALFGVGFLLHSGRLARSDLAWMSALLLALCVLLWGGWRLLNHRERSRRLLLRCASIWNRGFERWRRLEPSQLQERLGRFQDQLECYRRTLLWQIALASYGKVFLDVATLGACFLMFHYVVHPGALLTGYGLVLSFSGLAALPGGLGMADASTPVMFSWLRVPGAVALAAGLMYRLIAFWLLRFVGFFTWWFLEADMKRSQPSSPGS